MPRADDTGYEEPRRIAMIHRSRAVREAMVQYFAAATSLDIVAQAALDPDPVPLLRTVLVDVILIAFAVPATARIMRSLLAAGSQAPVVVFDVEGTEDAVLTLARARVAGCVTEDAGIDDLVSVVKRAARGQVACSASAGSALFRAFQHRDGHRGSRRNGITDRESEVLGLAVQGLTNKQIAAQLQIELSTVKNHLHNAYGKLEIRSRREARGAAGVPW
jgi:two-component system, NarL family, nitrate/nitrite response regulator NarL